MTEDEQHERYTAEFHEFADRHARQSATEIVPFLVELLCPDSVVDVGCGRGAWLHCFAEHGVNNILGMDFEPFDADLLQISPQCFQTIDLSRAIPIEGCFDLAICLEVGEHLPQSSAVSLVELLTGLASSVVFSAAIPFQRGLGHVNEQWPSYWLDHFSAVGWSLIDCIRPRFWANSHVSFWYAQNAFLFVSDSFLARRPDLRTQVFAGNPEQLALVHPVLYKLQNGIAEYSRGGLPPTV